MGQATGPGPREITENATVVSDILGRLTRAHRGGVSQQVVKQIEEDIIHDKLWIELSSKQEANRPFGTVYRGGVRYER